MNKTFLFANIATALCFNVTQAQQNERLGVVSKKYIAQFLPEKPVIIEAGAHKGYDTIEMKQQWPHAIIHSFEPLESLYRDLLNNVKNLNAVTCYKLALSNKNGTASFFVSSGQGDGSSSLLQPKEHLTIHPNVLFKEKIDVQTITLDTWAQKNNITKVDLLWLDLQGSELDVLKASPMIVQTVQVIYTEVSLLETYSEVPLYPEFRSWLEQQGFSVVREELPWQDMGNVLFVRTNLLKK